MDAQDKILDIMRYNFVEFVSFFVSYTFGRGPNKKKQYIIGIKITRKN